MLSCHKLNIPSITVLWQNVEILKNYLNLKIPKYVYTRQTVSDEKSMLLHTQVFTSRILNHSWLIKWLWCHKMLLVGSCVELGSTAIAEKISSFSRGIWKQSNSAQEWPHTQHPAAGFTGRVLPIMRKLIFIREICGVPL